MTAKIFSLFSLLGVTRYILSVRVIGRGLTLLALAHAILLVTHGQTNNLSHCQLLVQLYQNWVSAAFSGGEQLGATIVRGQQNHGFVAAVLRIFTVDAVLVHLDIFVALALGIILSFGWHFGSRSLKFSERWAGWLALGVVVHPLAWHHSFVMAYPLCALSLNRAVKTRNRGLIALSFFGISCITLFIPQVIGTQAVVPLEFVASKSWGVVLAGVVLVLANSRRFRGERNR